ncbi:MAG: PTS sugar transporter subunit IIA [Planctomycetales bacterium]
MNEQQVWNLDQLAAHLKRDRRDLEKLVQRGVLPGRKIGGEWQFHSSEITQWLEQEIRGYSDAQLAAVEEAQEKSDELTTIPVSTLLHLETVQVPLEARTKRSVLENLVEVAGRTWKVWEPAAILQAVQAREEVLSTAFENGVAIPHPRSPLPSAVEESIIAYGRTFSGIPFGAPRRQLTDIFFLVLCKDSRTHLLVLARLGRLLQLPGFLDELREAEDARSSYQVICDADEKIGRESR